MKWSFLIPLFLLPFLGNSQIDIFLLLEDQYSGTKIKYFVGQTIRFTTTYDPDNWQKDVIKEISPENNMVVFDNQFLHIHEFYKIATNNSGANFAGNMLYGFGASIAVVGGLGYGTDGQFRDALISVAVGGLLTIIARQIKKIFGRRKHRLENKWVDLRIVDTRFSVPEGTPSPIKTP